MEAEGTMAQERPLKEEEVTSLPLAIDKITQTQ
jgi:hypothetical protein